MPPVVEVQNISKKYKVVSPTTKKKEPFWSLKDIDFKVEKGQSLALLGKNGAGKSTLLKVIARIITPTRGQVVVRGNLAPMLELGAGFHHELTGRENTYVFGALIGIKRQEIKRKIDEIVNFAEVEPFIDTKVRSYSSGMILRLAFSIASSLNPDIILADELLAIADQEFRKKCLERMKKLQKEGTSIIMVQHDAEVLNTICKDAILMDKGRVVKEGKTLDLITP